MRKLLLILSLLIPSLCFAARGVIIVLEAPLLAAPSLDSYVKQVVRRGDIIYLHNKHFAANQLEPTSHLSEQTKLVDQANDSEEFYQTISKDGQAAFVQAKYIKVIFQDKREEGDPIARFDVDPTDYRLSEPLPDGYPLIDTAKQRGSAFVTFGTHAKTSYPFVLSNVTNESYEQSIGFQFIYARKVSYDLYDRFYFGVKAGFENHDIGLGFANGDSVNQSIGHFFAGPYISYDLYKSLKTRLTVFTTISLSLHRAYLTYKVSNGAAEERSFSAWGFTPEVGMQWQWLDFIVPEFDIVAGAHLLAQPATNLKASGEAQSIFWNQEQDGLNLKSGLRAQFVIGVQSRY